jgi:2-methylcitrate dehydratase PrpD
MADTEIEFMQTLAQGLEAVPGPIARGRAVDVLAAIVKAARKLPEDEVDRALGWALTKYQAEATKAHEENERRKKAKAAEGNGGEPPEPEPEPGELALPEAFPEHAPT